MQNQGSTSSTPPMGTGISPTLAQMAAGKPSITNPTASPTTSSIMGAGNNGAGGSAGGTGGANNGATNGAANNTASKNDAKPTVGTDAKPADKPDDKSGNKTDDPLAKVSNKVAQTDLVHKIVDKIKSSENILVALSKNPTVDDVAAAIGLTLYLDSIQRHVTAIYSGKHPDMLQFLQLDNTFEENTDSLQDFIISLSKDKADHLRYKLEGDYVKVYITPYRTNITEDDLTFSHGEYNVDFVIALDVNSAAELDGALSEHGRIMHNASTVNITTGAPGKFAEIDWSNPTASSVCEMVTQLILELQGNDEPLDKDIATALLTGIVASTDRFSNSRTNSDTLSLASKLMTMGADQQLISANVAGNEFSQEDGEPEGANDNLTVEHSEENPENTPETPTIVMPDLGNNAESESATAPANPAAELAGNAEVPTGPAPATMVIPDFNTLIPGGSGAESASVTAPSASNPVAPAEPAAPSGVLGSEMPAILPQVDASLLGDNTSVSAPISGAISSDTMTVPGMAPADQGTMATPVASVPPMSAEPVAPMPADSVAPVAPVAPASADPVAPAAPIASDPSMMTLPGVSPAEMELADRPNTVLPPPPAPPVDGSLPPAV